MASRACSRMKAAASATKFLERMAFGAALTLVSHSNRAMRLAAFLQIMLMIFFRAPERWSGFDPRHDWPIKPAALLQFFFRSASGGVLLWRMIENDRAILRSNIRALPVQCRGVMIGPENIQELVIAHLRRIEFYLHHLGMSGLVGANILVRRILLCSTRIADAGGQNTFHVAKCFFHAPKTPRTECRFLGLHGSTMKPLRHARNQMLAVTRDLTCLRWSHSLGP